MASDQRSPDCIARLGMLASAMSGRTVGVAPADSGEPAWTDGATIFLGTATFEHRQQEELAVQASLLAAGSLQPSVLRILKRRPAVARRYLAVEGHRALGANRDVLPPAGQALLDSRIAACTESPATSLAMAMSHQSIDDPPDAFGTIRARNLLSQLSKSSGGDGNQQVGRRRREQTMVELDDDGNEGGSDVTDIFSSPIGGGGVLGRMLRRLLRPVRRLGAGGQPGADTPTHRTRSGIRRGQSALSAAPTGLLEEQPGSGQGRTYPEWDVHRGRYRPNWCTVREVQPCVKDISSAAGVDGLELRRPLSRLGLGPDWSHRQVQGDDIDIDAAIEARVEVMAGCQPREAVYLARVLCRRDLSVLLLLDVSGSVAESGTAGKTVHEQQRAAAAALAVALHDLGDRLALYAFHSQGRSAVQLMPLKRFADDLDALMLRRLRGLVPGAYSRLGAAIRHGTAVLESQGGTTRRLLVVLSDGLAYDHGYDRGYGAADARRALAESRVRGTGCVCLTVGAETDPEELKRVFGSAAHAAVARPEQLSRVVGPLFRTALRSAEVRRPLSLRA